MLVNTMHITASVFINDDEPGLHQDFGDWLEELAPFNPDPDHYHHNRTGEDNADAHLKRQIMGREVVVAITKGKLDFGPWEQIFYGEFDGRRSQRAFADTPPANADALRAIAVGCVEDAIEQRDYDDPLKAGADIVDLRIGQWPPFRSRRGRGAARLSSNR